MNNNVTVGANTVVNFDVPKFSTVITSGSVIVPKDLSPFLPILIDPMITAPGPTNTLSPRIGVTFPGPWLLTPIVTFCEILQFFPIIESPCITTPPKWPR